MSTNNTHWAFNFEVLSRALKDLESTCTAQPGSPEFAFLRAEAPCILAEAREALFALKQQLNSLEPARERDRKPPTAH